ncbi:MAG: ABC transporter permease [Anaerolineales bacterium]
MILRLGSIIRKEFIQILRDPRTLIMTLIMPIMQLFLLGYAATTDIKNIPMAVWDQSRSPQSREMLDAFRSANYFTIAYDVGSQQQIQTLIEDGKVQAALIIPPDYSLKLSEGDAQVAVILDGSDATSGSTALSASQLIGQAYATKIMIENASQLGLSSAATPPVDFRTQVWYNPDLISADFTIPGVIGLILYVITTMLTASTIVRERERGTIEQLIVTPIRSWELVVGKITPYVVLGFFDTFEVLIIGHLWFGVPVRGSIALILISSGLLLLSSLGIGLFASTIANTQQEAMIAVWMTILPSIFLSGFFYPLEAMPPFLQVVSYVIPLRYYLIITRSLLIKGVGLAALHNDFIALAVFGVIIMGFAAMRFRKRLD